MKVAAFLELPQITDYPLSKPDYFQSYKELSNEVELLGADFYIVRHQSTYKGTGVFSKSWKYVGDSLNETGEVKVDVVYDKGEFKSDGNVKVLNCDFINELCTDKWIMYQKYKEYCPRTWLVQSNEELQKALQSVSTDIAVIKPVDGEEGIDVFIDSPKKLLTQHYNFPVLIQEFIDTSSGVPNIVDGLHDFRIAILNGEIIYSYYRTPPQGSYLANVARGGKFALVNVDKIPTEAIDLVLQIDKELEKYGKRFYGVDLGFTSQGPKIIEMNSRLGLLPNSDGEAFVRLKKKLAQTLVSMV